MGQLLDHLRRRCRHVLTAVLVMLPGAAQPAIAMAATRVAVSIAATAGRTDITLSSDRRQAFCVSIDGAAGALVIAFEGPVSLAGKVPPRGLVRDAKAVGARLVVALAHQAVIDHVRWLSAGSNGDARAEIALSSGDAIAMRSVSGIVFRPQPSASPALPPAAGSPAVVQPHPPQALARKPGAQQPQATIPLGRKVIVVDAGHGGIDPGAESVTSYHEKEVTLATARILKRLLEQTGRYRVALTRESDVYLKLHERVARARAAHGDLFISLHADSVVGGEGDARGASIYTLSETASDAESERYAQRENRADALGGDLGSQTDQVAGILVDLTVRETVNNGNRLANLLVETLQRDGVSLFPRLPHRSAGFAVLKAPDIPSVLVEMGYLSDRSDARALADPHHQLAIAKGIADGIDRYFALVQASRS